MATKIFSGENALKKITEDIKKETITACIKTVNEQAYLTRTGATQNLRRNLILRNQFTEKSITYTQCPKSVKKYKDIQSVVGALQRADYLKRQEEGGIRKPRIGGRLAIPTTAARGGRNSNRLQKKYRLDQIAPVRGSNKKYKSNKARSVARAVVAFREKKYIRYNDKLFIVKKFERRNDIINFQKTEIYNLQRTTTQTPPTPWLEPATLRPAQQSQEIFNSKM